MKENPTVVLFCISLLPFDLEWLLFLSFWGQTIFFLLLPVNAGILGMSHHLCLEKVRIEGRLKGVEELGR